MVGSLSSHTSPWTPKPSADEPSLVAERHTAWWQRTIAPGLCRHLVREFEGEKQSFLQPPWLKSWTVVSFTFFCSSTVSFPLDHA